MPTEDLTNSLIERADALEGAGLLREALMKWREIVAIEKNAVSLCRLGRLAAELKEHKEAEKAYLASIAAAPRWSLPHEALAILYRDAGELQKAEKYLRLSLGIEKKARTLAFLGDVLERLGRHSEAEGTLQEALAADPSYAEAHFLLGRVAREDPKKAISQYRRALELDPNYALAQRELGWTFRRMDQPEKAEEHVRKAIELDKSDMWSFIYLGNILWRKGDLEGAKGAFQQAISRDPRDSTGYWCLADLLRAQGRESEARRLLKESLRASINDIQANLRYALLLRDAGEHRKAKRYLRRVLHLDPENVTARRAFLNLS